MPNESVVPPFNSANESPTDKPLPPNVKLLGATSLVNDIASEMIYPLLPKFLLSVLGGSKFGLGFIEGLADSVAALLKLWSGAWSDRIGRRKGFVVFGYGLAAGARPMIGLITSSWQLLPIRTADRFGKGIRAAPRDALLAESAEPSARGRAFGFNRAMDHLGAAIGPILASLFLLVWPEQYRALFLLTIVPGVAVFCLVLFGLRETVAAPKPAAKKEPFQLTLKKEPFQLTLKPFDRDFRLFLVSLVVFTLGNSSDVFLLVRAGELGVPTAFLPLLWCVFHIVKSAGSYWSGGVVDRIGPRPLIIVGWMLYAVVYLLFALASEAWQIWALFLVYGVFYALTEPAEKTFVAMLVGGERKGLAFGWFNFAIGVAAMPSSLIFGWLYDQFNALVAFGWGAALAMLAVVLLLGVRKPA
jgi:MFS family permease